MYLYTAHPRSQALLAACVAISPGTNRMQEQFDWSFEYDGMRLFVTVRGRIKYGRLFEERRVYERVLKCVDQYFLIQIWLYYLQHV